jgi:hypothetical protein
MPSNQGSEMIDAVFEDVDITSLNTASKVMWREARNHPSTSTCECPATEVLCSLYESGYRLVKE